MNARKRRRTEEAAGTEPAGQASRSVAPLRLIVQAARSYPWIVAAALAALLITSAATLAIPSGFKLIIDRGFTGGGEIGRWFQYLLMIVVVLAIGTALRFYFVSWLGERVVADLRVRVNRHLLDMPPAFFEENSPGEIASRMTADTAIIEQTVSSTVSVALRNIVTAIGGTIYMFILAPGLSIYLLLAIPAVILPILWFGRKVRDLSKSSQDRIADVGAMTGEVLGAMQVVQAFNQEDRERARFRNAVERSFDTAAQRIRMRSVLTGIVIFLIFGAITLLLWKGAIEVAAGNITGGTIAAFVITVGLVAGAFGSLTEVYGSLLRAAGAAQRMGELLDARPSIAPPERPQTLPVPPRGAIAFQNVTFRYPARPDQAALQDFSLTIEPGETIAIVGPSGAGKSTLFQLVARFRDPQAGSVRIDGVELTRADPAAIRQRIALVPQESVLFAADARYNIQYGAPQATDEAIWEAARAANAETFLRDLPQGLDTFIGEGGARLSGGQRQRIAIARAILRDSPILLLDEATSALDAESERLVQSALDHLMQGRTTLVIAHRLATVRAADRIVVMDEGRVVEIGDHDTLSAAGGLYARLARLQFDESRFDAAKGQTGAEAAS
ncbi:ABC transporter transmembrane domain-containing protein [Croceicoccus naphthovorans]|uniref:ABC transporter n=1 Tax=Croceicoccus naphthovorans TaxID=1348774 RepID=A0A0G3XLH2_9SPHN|nr:ABC transporter transmembrane domain-containing protein [Croceicoccus naphthovorans]AKM11278.1 ABC transporter [Croceicoccus naphthovorans]MBB3989804.1 ATP-binding cassette subfamily B protein [Croceicoccus naphthovorans]